MILMKGMRLSCQIHKPLQCERFLFWVTIYKKLTIIIKWKSQHQLKEG
jgi:hypothetical protein